MKIVNSVTSSSNNKKYNTSFKSVNFIEFNDKYRSLKNQVYSELSKFDSGIDNASLLGEGKFGNAYRFKNSQLRNVVIKKSKKEYKDNYELEYKNLVQVPNDKVGGQAAIARAYNPATKEYYMLSTMAEGKEISNFNRYTDNHLRSLFNKMFELDKLGIYHGDLNGKNILLTNSGDINFIDYQWSQIVPKSNFFDSVKTEMLLLPASHFPENAQMFEMATIPYYLESIGSQRDKEQFLKFYFKNKAQYHLKRCQYIKKVTQNWPYFSELSNIRESIASEQAKANVYKNISDSILKLELKKFQFLSDYRDAYGHVDPNIFDRNILSSSSSYLCSISAVQDFRKEVAKQLKTCVDSDMKTYLKAQQTYGDFWYNSLRTFSSDTFDYVMRAITKNLKFDETKHDFYKYDRNPRLMKSNRNVIAAMDSRFQTTYDKNFSVPYALKDKMHNIYSAPMELIKPLSQMTDLKAYHRRKKIQHAYGELKSFERNGQVLDLLNTSEVMTLKAREFKSYAYHNMNSLTLDRLLEKLLSDSVEFTENLYKTILNGLSEYDANRILVQGYKNMRKFVTKV